LKAGVPGLRARATGELRVRGRHISPRPSAHALLTVEGGRDDICAVDSTLAAQDLCTACVRI